MVEDSSIGHKEDIIIGRLQRGVGKITRARIAMTDGDGLYLRYQEYRRANE